MERHPATDNNAPHFLAMMVRAPRAVDLVALIRGSFAPVAEFGPPQWSAIVFLGVAGGAFTFFLWSFALRHTTPTRVAISVTVNPISASLVASVLLHEPIHWNLLVGLLAVFVGIWLALTVRRPAEQTNIRVESA